jgi:hypothetical protein
VGGTVRGLPGGSAITLQLDGDETLVVASNGDFRFRDEISAGNRYSVTIIAQPARADCTIANGTGASTTTPRAWTT